MVEGAYSEGRKSEGVKFEHSQNTPEKDGANAVTGFLKDRYGSIEFSGNSKEPQKIEYFPDLVTYTNSYDACSFVVKSPDGKRAIDLVGITPEGWGQKLVNISKLFFDPLEKDRVVNRYKTVDPKNRIVMTDISDFDEGNPEIENTLKDVLWYTLVARYISEIGEPKGEESINDMRGIILQRRQEVLDVFTGSQVGDLEKTATKSFKNPQPTT